MPIERTSPTPVSTIPTVSSSTTEPVIQVPTPIAPEGSPTAPAVTPTTTAIARTVPADVAGTVPSLRLPRAVTFVDAAHGWLVACIEPGGAGSAPSCKRAGVLATTDGGKSWHAQLDLARFVDPLGASLSFVDPRHGWLMTTSPDGCTMGGCWGPLYRTTDGGQTWN